MEYGAITEGSQEGSEEAEEQEEVIPAMSESTKGALRSLSAFAGSEQDDFASVELMF